ncbi:MAG: peptidoglycan-binding protein, partial [Hyphomicrobiales bacterium]
NAAELGLKDSQYNLGILHERGLGVPNDMTQAYKWFALAARQGDADAATRKTGLETRLPADQLVRAKLDVENWAPQATDKRANVVTPPAKGWAKQDGTDELALFSTGEMIAEAQQMLNKLGYVVGTPDGIIGARTRQAVRRFQKAKGMSETGHVTPSLLQRLRETTSS